MKRHRVAQTNIKTIKQGDDRWLLKDGIVVCPRAGFEVSDCCPKEYKQIILQAIEYGYIKPVAHVYGKELTLDSLREN